MVRPGPPSRTAHILVALAFCALTAAWYVSAGLARAWFAEDDFTWLLGGLAFGWPQFDVTTRTHFFRPVINLWFGGATGACGVSAACYHLANLTVHLANVALVFALALTLSRRTRVAVLTTLLFVLLPGYAQTVVWVSAITGLLATMWFLVSLVLQVDAIGRERNSPRHALAIVAFGLAVFSHEATATLPLVSVLLHWWFSPRRWMPRTLVIGFASILALFAVTTLTANRHNYVFTENHYAVGLHMVRSAFDYIAALYIGPHTVIAYLVSAVAMAVLLFCNRVTRFGTAWLVITLLPFLGFTWGNAGRYLYLPSIGFAMAMASVLTAGGDRLARRWTQRGAALAVGAVTLLVAARFAVFAWRAIHAQVDWTATSASYVMQVEAFRPPPGAHTATVPAPPPALIDSMYVEPMLRWAWQDPGLTVTVVPTRIPR